MLSNMALGPTDRASEQNNKGAADGRKHWMDGQNQFPCLRRSLTQYVHAFIYALLYDRRANNGEGNI